MKARKTVAAFSLLTLGLITVACGDDEESADTTAAATEETTAEGEAVCPTKLTIQTDWFPELEHGGTYQLIGPDGTASKDTVSYFGPVQPQYAVGGLKEIEIKTVNFDKANSAVLLDGDADMAYINISDVIKDSSAVPMVAIAKTLDQDPQMVMWDPTQHDIQTPEDMAATGATVLHFPGTAYIDYMIGQGYITADQSNPSYDGSDAKWVAESGNLIQQGFATNEVYKYENDIAWKDGAPADVSFFTVAEMGFDNYPATITMLKSRVEELDACLTLLVPMMQQAWIDFLNDPKPITDALIEINVTHDGFWALSEGLNEAGIALLEEKKIAANSPDGTYCTLDPAKVAALYEQLKPIYAEQGVEITDDVTTVYDNKYCAGAPGR
ncbi:MAG: hypothetical protein RLZZ362_2523 [Actinomycetota bacterium]|jgi:hypothetical protein